MAQFTALYDSCVLYPAPLRDLLLRVALTDLFRAKWTADIHAEWMRSVLEDRPELAARLERTRTLMDAHVRDCLVEGYHDLIPSLTLPDPDDRHVLAAAIRGRADVIVTFNLRDFPATALDPFGIDAQHPDEFIRHLIDLAPGVVAGAAREHRASLKSPPKTAEDYLLTLEQQQLPETVAALRQYVDVL